MPQLIHAPYTHIWSNNDLLHALALSCNINYSQLPIHADEWLRANTPGNHLIVLDMLREKAKYRNAFDWRETLNSLEKNWFLPLYNALKKGDINQLAITGLSEISSQTFVAKRSSLWKFWRMAKPLPFYLK